MTAGRDAAQEILPGDPGGGRDGDGQGSVTDPSKIHYGPEREGSYLHVDWNPGMDPGYTEPRAAADV